MKSMAQPYKMKVLKKKFIEFYVDGIGGGDNPIGDDTSGANKVCFCNKDKRWKKTKTLAFSKKTLFINLPFYNQNRMKINYFALTFRDLSF